MERGFTFIPRCWRVGWLHDFFKLFARCDEFDFGEKLWVFRAVRVGKRAVESFGNVDWLDCRAGVGGRIADGG